MHKVWLIVHREYLERIRSKTFLIFTLLLPALMAGSHPDPGETGGNQIGHRPPHCHRGCECGLGDGGKAGTARSANSRVLHGLSLREQHRKTTSWCRLAPRRRAELHDALGQQVSAGTIDGFLWLNEDDLANHKATYSARDVADFQTNAAVRSALRTALVKQYLAQKGMTGPQVETLLTPVVLRTVHITKGHEGASGMTVFLTGFIMVMLLYVNVLVYGMSRDAFYH